MRSDFPPGGTGSPSLPENFPLLGIFIVWRPAEPHLVEAIRLRYILRRHDAEGSHNGSAAVLKTADRKVMQVRVLSPPPFLFNLIRQFTLSLTGFLLWPFAGLFKVNVRVCVDFDVSRTTSNC